MTFYLHLISYCSAKFHGWVGTTQPIERLHRSKNYDANNKSWGQFFGYKFVHKICGLTIKFAMLLFLISVNPDRCLLPHSSSSSSTHYIIFRAICEHEKNMSRTMSGINWFLVQTIITFALLRLYILYTALPKPSVVMLVRASTANW
jgi:hypothetical protein